MNPKSVYCFNPFCGEKNELNELTESEKCYICCQNSLKLGGAFYAVKIIKKKDNSIKSFIARKYTEENDNYFVKIIFNNNWTLTNIENAKTYEDLKRNHFTKAKRDSELNSHLRKIKTEAPDSIPAIQEVYFNVLCVYVVSKRINGINLKKKISNEGVLTKDRLLQIFKEIAEALKKIHDKGIVHGDIKPENIIFSERDNGKIFFVDPLAAKSFDEYNSYIPKKHTAYTPPDLQEYIDNPTEHSNYQQDYTKSHDLYAISALFIKVLSNQIGNENDVRSDDGKWLWDIGIDGIDGIDELKKLLDRLVAKQAAFRNGEKVDVLIDCISSLQQQTQDPGSLPPNDDDFWIRLLLSWKQLEGLDRFYHNLPPTDRKKPWVRGLMYIIPALVILSPIAWAVITFNSQKNVPIPTPTPTPTTSHLYKLTEQQLQPLKDSLTSNNPDFKQADILTQKLLLELFKKDRVRSTSTIKFNQDNVTNNHNQIIPVKKIKEYCLDLDRIDELWRSASSNAFGFKAQKEVVDAMKFNRTTQTSKEKRDEDFYAKQANSLGWGLLKTSHFEAIEKTRNNNQDYESQREKIIEIIKDNGGYVDRDINIKSLSKFKGYYPITVKLGTTEHWPNFGDWCSSDYEERRKKRKLDN